jgi:pSer/pThr/pTyr-binding forkhead associated (FHA) protein
VDAELEVWTVNGRSRAELTGDRMTIGKDAGNDIVLDDTTVSRLHAICERFPAGWCINDLGSSNGTFLNGERIWAHQRLRHGDEVRIGGNRLLFRDSSEFGQTQTESASDCPALTPRERDVLVVLCRPLLARDLFTEPASIKELAAELVVSEAAVKQHLTNLYGKFEIGESRTHRRTRLANEAIQRGAVSIADLRRTDGP